MFDSIRKLWKENAYVMRMVLASIIVMAKVYIVSYLVGEERVAGLLTYYYLTNVMVVVLPLGAFLFMHSELPRSVAMASGNQAQRTMVGSFCGSSLLLLAVVAVPAWWLVDAYQDERSATATIIYTVGYAVSQIALLSVKVFRNYDRFARLLIIRAATTTGIIVAGMWYGTPIANVIALEGAALLLFGMFSFGRGLTDVRLGVGWWPKISAFAFPSAAGAVFANTDRLLAASMLGTGDLARYGVLYLVVGAAGTLIQFVNTKLLPELYISRGLAEAGAPEGGISNLLAETRPWKSCLLGLLGLIGVSSLGMPFVYVATLAMPFDYAAIEVAAASLACTSRAGELVGSYGMAKFGIYRVAAIQSAVVIAATFFFFRLEVATLASFMLLTVTLNGFFAMAIVIRGSMSPQEPVQ